MERTRSAERAGDAFGVQALEAASCHLGRDSVASHSGAPEAQGGGPTVPGGIYRREEQCGPGEEVGGSELDFGVELRPVLGQIADELVPLARERCLAMPRLGHGNLGRRGVGGDQVEPAPDALLVEPADDAFRVARRCHLEPKARAHAPRRQRGEDERDAVGVGVLGHPQGQLRRAPALREGGLDLLPLVGESHRGKSSDRLLACRRVATLEEKGQVSSSGRLKEFLREMLLIRRFEEKVEERFRAGELPGFLHVAIGQEAVAVGVCQALEENDVIASTHRAHGHTLAKGTHPNEVMAELYGKAEGMSHGYGGSMHLYDMERGNLGANAVVGGGLPGIVGSALAFKMRGEPRVAVAFFGDGATNIGTFHESLNLAQLWTVPAVFVCENNHYAESTPAKQGFRSRI